MGSNGADEEMLSGGNGAECSETTVEIKIKTLDSQTYTLRVNKCMPVPALKEQIATVTGVVSEQQRLICRGKVLKDDQLLSAYHVEDGHTLHLVVRRAVPPSSVSLPDYSATVPALSSGHVQGNQAAPGELLGTFNMADQGDGLIPDVNQIISAIFSNFGITDSGSEGLDLQEPVLERHELYGASGTMDETLLQAIQAATGSQSDPLHGAFQLPPAVSFGPLQSPVIPDSLTTLSQYLSCLRHEFLSGTGSNRSNGAQAAGMHQNEGRESDAALNSGDVQGGLTTPPSLAEVMMSTRQILVEQVGECLSQFTRQLEDHANVTNPLVRMSIQSTAMRSGILLQNLGSLLLELGRTMMTIRMGQTPSEAVVNAGPAVFISRSGPNPLMVQPLPFQPGTSFGAIPMGTVHTVSDLADGTLSSGFLPRHIDVQILTGSSMSTSNFNQGEQAAAQQPQGQAGPARSSSGTSHDHQEDAGASWRPAFICNSGVRGMPIRSVVAALPALVSRPPFDSSGSSVGLFHPVLTRVQHVESEHLNNTRGPQASDARHPSDLETEQQPIPESAVQQRSYEGLLPAPTARQQEPFNLNNSSNSNTFSSGGTQTGQESPAHISSRFGQLLRTFFAIDQIHVGDANFHGLAATSSTAEHVGPTMGAAAAAQVAAPTVDDEGTFLFGLLRQIIPVISQVVAMEPNVASPERADTSEHRTAQESSAQDEENSDIRALHGQSDSPSTPSSSKRQKKE